MSLNGTTLPPAPVDDMLIHPRERDLVVGTHGRSIYVMDDVSMFAQLNKETCARALALLDIMPARPRIYHEDHYGNGHGIFRAKNPPMGAYINFWVGGAVGDPVSVSIADSTGFVLRELSDVSRPGLNRIVWDLKADPKHRLDVSPNDIPGPEQFVPAGKYKVSVKVGEAKDEKFVQVLSFQ
jgi:hypothetical protein